MFIGIYYHTLEAKGRLAIPAKFRKQLKKGSVITRGLDGCLFLFPASEWGTFMKKLQESPLSQADARGFIRLMTNEAREVEFDRQGRTHIPQYLKEYAGLKTKTVIAGTLNRIEIWDRETYHKYIEKIEEKGGKLAESLKELGI
jgi:MraZ protein